MRYVMRVVSEVEVQVEQEQVMTLSEAAKRLRVNAASLRGAINRGELRWLVDPAEPNPTHAGRVYVEDVERAALRRRGRGRGRPGRLPARREGKGGAKRP